MSFNSVLLRTMEQSACSDKSVAMSFVWQRQFPN